MTGWNLPPGCNVRDLPGNSAEEERAEALWDTIADTLTEHGIDCEKEGTEKLIEAIAKIVGDAYGEGYQQGTSDKEEAEFYQKQEEADAEVIVPCIDKTENHKWVVSDENENICYCERCGCMEY